MVKLEEVDSIEYIDLKTEKNVIEHFSKRTYPETFFDVKIVNNVVNSTTIQPKKPWYR